MSARKGAINKGKATIKDTKVAETPNSTIITRLRVPTSMTMAMPTESWKSDKRSRRESGKSSLAASAKGKNRDPNWVKDLAKKIDVLFIKKWPGAQAPGRSSALADYLGKAASADAGADATTAALPLRKFLTHVVFIVSAKCTLNDEIATAAMNTGMPTEGFTTNHIFE
jgi:hypothetical protein